MRNSKVLVLLSTYNGEKFLNSQLDSILNQKTTHKVDLLIRDDGSTDTTLDILTLYQKKYPDRITLIKGKNIGYNKSFFELINLADNYDFYALSDQDDIWLENKIETALEWLMKEDQLIPLLYGAPSYLVYDDLKPYGTTQMQKRKITFKNTIIQNFLPGHEQVMNQLLLNELKKNIDLSKIYVHDSWITNVAMVKGKVIFNNTPFVFYRQHKDNAIGYGNGYFSWIKERVRRIIKSDNKKYAIQINYFYEMYSHYLDEKDYNELHSFIKNNKNFFSRCKYILTSKLYRQTHFQTFLFKILYLLGGYKI